MLSSSARNWSYKPWSFRGNKM